MILVIVESPAKIKKISGFLGSKYNVQASYGHFRDLDNKTMSIDFDNNFEPFYVITKPDVVKRLKKANKECSFLYIASDLDYEGSAIGQSILDVLKPKQYKRLIFNAITKDAIIKSIENAKELDKNQVNAQKARRVIDRLFGYLISPIIQKHFSKNLSAGRVQSPTVKIIIEKENEITSFNTISHYKVSGIFNKLNAILSNKLNQDYIITFLNKCLKSTFVIFDIVDKISIRSPSAPFTTSTLQQEANSKLNFSPDMTMKLAQKLYEGGYITYMRTDSKEISKEGHKDIKKIINEKYKGYYQKNEFKNKTNSQEAHEAIRPTHCNVIEIDDKSQNRLYKLIWKRTLASQMKSAKYKILTIKISISKIKEYYFESIFETLIDPGFLIIYGQNKEDELINTYQKDQILDMKKIIGKEEYTKASPRYTEASLIKKLEELGIGRPSTYVNIIKTIIDRKYVKIDNIEGIKKNIKIYTAKKGEITEEEEEIIIGKEKKKIIPTPIGIIVNNFLDKNFSNLIDYKMTSNLEENLDQIANGNKIWYKVVKDFYDQLYPIIDKLNINNDRLLDSKDKIYATITKYGPAVKMLINNKYKYAKINVPLTFDTITKEEAKELLEYPKSIGMYKKKEIIIKKGPYGIYMNYNKKNYPLKKKINKEEAIKIINKII